jgi:lysophospholipase L1-like esterase
MMRRRSFLAAVALLAELALPAASRATVPVHNGQKVVFVGDSITAFGWMSVSGGLTDQINAALPSRMTRNYATVSGTRAVSTGTAATVSLVTLAPTPITVVNSGVAGQACADIAAAVASRITNYNPDVVVIECGINGENVPPSQMAADYASILSQVRAWSATVPIACVSILGFFEQWVPGPPPASTPGNDVSPFNVALKGSCDAVAGTTWIDNYTPFYLYESTHNTPAPGASSGVLLLDDRHPNPTGQLQMGNWDIGYFQMLP